MARWILLEASGKTNRTTNSTIACSFLINIKYDRGSGLNGLWGSAGSLNGARDGAYGGFTVFLIFTIIALVVHALLYKGVKDRSSMLFLPWLIVIMIIIVVMTIGIIAGTITAIYYTGSKLP